MFLLYVVNIVVVGASVTSRRREQYGLQRRPVIVIYILLVLVVWDASTGKVGSYAMSEVEGRPEGGALLGLP